MGFERWKERDEVGVWVANSGCGIICWLVAWAHDMSLWKYKMDSEIDRERLQASGGTGLGFVWGCQCILCSLFHAC